MSKIEIIKPKIDSRGITTMANSFTNPIQFINLIIDLEQRMQNETNENDLRAYYIEVNKVLDIYKAGINKYLSETNIPGKFKRGTKRRTVGENLNYNRKTRVDIDKCVAQFNLKGIGLIMESVEDKLKNIPKPKDMPEKRELDRVHSVLIYAIDQVRKMIKRKYDDDNKFRTNIIDKKWKKCHRDPKALERKQERKELKEQRTKANLKIKDKFKIGELYLWKSKGEIVEVINHGKMLWLKRSTTTKPVRIIDIDINDLIKINDEE